jgi:hypothetical protein
VSERAGDAACGDLGNEHPLTMRYRRRLAASPH